MPITSSAMSSTGRDAPSGDGVDADGRDRAQDGDRHDLGWSTRRRVPSRGTRLEQLADRAEERGVGPLVDERDARRRARGRTAGPRLAAGKASNTRRWATIAARRRSAAVPWAVDGAPDGTLDLVEDLGEQEGEQVLLAVEVVVERRLGDAGGGGDVLHLRGVEAEVGEELGCGEDLLAHPVGQRAHWTRSLNSGSR